MTDRGLPIVDGAPACPFVAFEDDRDGRGLAPDHRHRCFAEAHPAPRALAHQEAYCLSTTFPVCPTFQDWARREAAAARPRAVEDRVPRDEPPVSRPMPPLAREPRHARGTDTPPPIPPRRNPHRDWAAPPPWSGDGEPGSEPVESPGFLFGRGTERGEGDWGSASRGLAGSAADRLAGPDLDAAPPLPRAGRGPGGPRIEEPEPLDAVGEDADYPDDAEGAGDADDWTQSPPSAPVSPQRRMRGRPSDGPPVRAAARGSATGSRRDQVRRRSEEEAAELFGPAWERPRRYEAYPSLRTRVGLPNLSMAWVGVAALVLAAVVLFFVGPMLLGIGGKAPDTGARPTPSPSVAATATPVPTAIPGPTPTIYIVAKNDTMSKIAKKFGVTVEQIMAANPKITNADKIKIGDPVTIPAPVASDVPGETGGFASP